MRDEFAAGASSARNKIASHLTAHGVPVVRTSPYGPPTDDDFLRAALAGPAGGVRRERVTVRWRGPVYVDLDFVSSHERTLRYDAGPDGGGFKAYLPKPLLPRRRQSAICLGLAAGAQLLPARVELASEVLAGFELGRYAFIEEKTKVLLYEGGVEGPRVEKLYVPRVILGNQRQPDDIFVRVYV